jgi:hypothetical protein
VLVATLEHGCDIDVFPVFGRMWESPYLHHPYQRGRGRGEIRLAHFAAIKADTSPTADSTLTPRMGVAISSYTATSRMSAATVSVAEDAKIAADGDRRNNEVASTTDKSPAMNPSTAQPARVITRHSEIAAAEAVRVTT